MGGLIRESHVGGAGKSANTRSGLPSTPHLKYPVLLVGGTGHPKGMGKVSCGPEHLKDRAEMEGWRRDGKGTRNPHTHIATSAAIITCLDGGFGIKAELERELRVRLRLPGQPGGIRSTSARSLPRRRSSSRRLGRRRGQGGGRGALVLLRAVRGGSVRVAVTHGLTGRLPAKLP